MDCGEISILYIGELSDSQYNLKILTIIRFLKTSIKPKIKLELCKTSAITDTAVKTNLL